MFAAAITSKVPSALAHEIEDAVLLGNAREIGEVLDAIDGDETFPADVRNALETLRYFNLYYGKGGECEPANEKDRQAVAQLESLWRQELVAMIGAYADILEK